MKPLPEDWLASLFGIDTAVPASVRTRPPSVAIMLWLVGVLGAGSARMSLRTRPPEAGVFGLVPVLPPPATTPDERASELRSVR